MKAFSIHCAVQTDKMLSNKLTLKFKTKFALTPFPSRSHFSKSWCQFSGIVNEITFREKEIPHDGSVSKRDTIIPAETQNDNCDFNDFKRVSWLRKIL